MKTGVIVALNAVYYYSVFDSIFTILHTINTRNK